MDERLSDTSSELRLELQQAIANGEQLADDEHPMLLYMKWRIWHDSMYWLLADALGRDRAEEFAEAGGGLHQGATKLLSQVAVLKNIATEL